MLLFPLEAPGRLLFLPRADRARGNRVVSAHCWADEARLPTGKHMLGQLLGGQRRAGGERERAREVARREGKEGAMV